MGIKKTYEIVWEIKTQKFDLEKDGEDIEAGNEEEVPVTNDKKIET